MAYSMYSVKIKHYNHILKPTLNIYRHAVDFLISVSLEEWNDLSILGTQNERVNRMEQLTVRTKNNPSPKHCFEDADKGFYKFPCYLRRAAIAEALGKVSSYKSNYANWEAEPKGNAPSKPVAGFVYPAMYKDNMFVRTGTYTAKIKVFIRNTWDWLEIDLRKSDVDYINRYCLHMKECVPVIQKRGKQWFLDSPFQGKNQYTTTPAKERTILAVDLGLNNACTCSVMKSDGTILGRKFLSLPKEQDSLEHALNRIKKAQHHGARKMPRLWARAKGLNDDIAVKTAKFIMEVAVLYNVDVIVFEKLDTSGKKKGSKKQRLHHWKANYVQSMVTHKAHRCGIRISHICAWGTSKLAFDGSGTVERSINGNYSICKFKTGKRYNCDLSASYNIGARYFIRELLKSLPETVRLGIEAKVPQCAKRSTCTLSTLHSLCAVLEA